MKIMSSFVLKIVITCIPIVCNIIAGILIFSFIDAQNEIDQNAMNKTMEKAVRIESKLNKTSESLKLQPDLFGTNNETVLEYLVSQFSREFETEYIDKAINRNYSKPFSILQTNNNCSAGYSDDDIAKLKIKLVDLIRILKNHSLYMKENFETIKNAWFSFPNLKEKEEMIIKKFIELYWQRIQRLNSDLIIPVHEVVKKTVRTIPKNQIEVSERISSWRLSIAVSYGIIITSSIVFCVSEICYLVFVVKQGSDKHSLLFLNLITLSTLCSLIMLIVLIIFGILHAVEVFPENSISMPNLSKVSFKNFFGQHFRNVHTKCISPKKFFETFQISINHTRYVENAFKLEDDMTKHIKILIKISRHPNLEELLNNKEEYLATESKIARADACIPSMEDKYETYDLYDVFFRAEHIIDWDKIMDLKLETVIRFALRNYSQKMLKYIIRMNDILQTADFDCEYFQVSEYENLNSQIFARFSNYKTFIGPFASVLMIICCISIFVAHFMNSKILGNEEKQRQIEIVEKKKVEQAKKNDEERT